MIQLAVLGFAVALVRGGRLANLVRMDLRAPLALVLPFLLRAGLYTAAGAGLVGLLPLAPWIHVGAYLLLAYGCWCNRHLPGFWLILLGTISNLVAIAANGGRMPASEWALRATGQADVIPVLQTPMGDYVHSLLTPASHLGFLTDVIPLPSPLPLPVAMSIGDLFIVFGLVLLINRVMVQGQGLAPQSDVA